MPAVKPFGAADNLPWCVVLASRAQATSTMGHSERHPSGMAKKRLRAIGRKFNAGWLLG